MSNEKTRLFIDEEITDFANKFISYPSLNDRVQEFYKTLITDIGNKETFTQKEVLDVINRTFNSSTDNNNLKVRNVIEFAFNNADLDTTKTFEAYEIFTKMKTQKTIELTLQQRELIISLLNNLIDKMKPSEKTQGVATVTKYWQIPVVYVKHIIESGKNNENEVIQ